MLEDISIPRADCASALELQRLQPAELHGLIAAFVDSEEDPGPLLRAAAKQQLVPERLRAAPDWTKNVWIVHNIMVPSHKQSFQLADSKLKLHVIMKKRLTGKATSVFITLHVSASSSSSLDATPVKWLPKHLCSF